MQEDWQRLPDIMKEMVESDATICLTIAGALTPIGFGKIISTYDGEWFH